MDNSFFDDDFYDNKKILILAPHHDDESNIAGRTADFSVIRNVSAELYCSTIAGNSSVVSNC